MVWRNGFYPPLLNEFADVGRVFTRRLLVEIDLGGVRLLYHFDSCKF